MSHRSPGRVVVAGQKWIEAWLSKPGSTLEAPGGPDESRAPYPFQSPDGSGHPDGTKTQTAGGCNPKSGTDSTSRHLNEVMEWREQEGHFALCGWRTVAWADCPLRASPAIRLWVRETWHAARSHDSTPPRDIPFDADIEYAVRSSAAMPNRVCRKAAPVHSHAPMGQPDYAGDRQHPRRALAGHQPRRRHGRRMSISEHGLKATIRANGTPNFGNP